MRVAFIGTRGVPARYSGFETFVEQLGARLAERGHDVTVYCRRHHLPERQQTYRGMSLVYVPGIATKHLDTISHTAVSCAHAMTRRYDAVIMCISGNSPFALPLRASGTPVLLNVDGSDWRRQKWGALARRYIRVSEWLSTRLPTVTITDSRVMHGYYLDRFGVDTACIAYGSELPPPTETGVLDRLGVAPGRYLLLVGRMVPENCIHHLVDAYEMLDTDLDCVVVGDAPYADHYKAELRHRGVRVKFPGYVFGEGYRELMHNARCVVLCSEVGGTHPVLVEAMSAGNCVIVNDTPANLEVIGDAGVSYEGRHGADALAGVLREVALDDDTVRGYQERARERAHQYYSWDTVTDQYESLLYRAVREPASDIAPLAVGSDIMER